MTAATASAHLVSRFPGFCAKALGAVLVLIVYAACSEPPSVPPEGLPDLHAAVSADPEILQSSADGCVRVFGIWKAQVRAVHETAGSSWRDRLRALVEQAYQPYESFWRGYLGDESDFRDWARRSI